MFFSTVLCYVFNSFLKRVYNNLLSILKSKIEAKKENLQSKKKLSK